MPALTEPFASHYDLAARLGLELSAADQLRADSLLLAASRLIQDEARQYIAAVADEVLTLRGTTDERIRMPERPVTAVSSLTLAGQALIEGTDWYLDGNELVRMPSIIVLDVLDVPFPLGRGFGSADQELVVTYSHGYADIPGVCQTVCLEAVVRVWVNPGAVSMENVSGVAVGYAEQRGLVLTEAERKAVRRFFGRRAFSVTLGG